MQWAWAKLSSFYVKYHLRDEIKASSDKFRPEASIPGYRVTAPEHPSPPPAGPAGTSQSSWHRERAHGKQGIQINLCFKDWSPVYWAEVPVTSCYHHARLRAEEEGKKQRFVVLGSSGLSAALLRAALLWTQQHSKRPTFESPSKREPWSLFSLPEFCFSQNSGGWGLL